MRRITLASLLALAAGLAMTPASLRAGPLTPVKPEARAGGAANAAADAPLLAADALPIQEITLYRSGVGYFERRGQIAGDSRVSLRFEKDQINDILKSMVILDLSGGAIDAVGYGSKEPLARRLGSFGVNIADNPSMADLMARLRGAKVRLTTADGPIEGTVLGTEMRAVPAPGPRITTGGANAGGDVGPGGIIPESFVNIVTATGMKSVPVSRINAFEILDKKLAEELNLALAALAEARDENTAGVDLAFRGVGARDVVLGYVHETPVWKTSYRLILPDDSSGGAGKPQLQGWAIVENTTDGDWSNVHLALASGNPVGFRMDLHEPLFVARPEIPVPVAMAVRPKMYEAGEAPMRVAADAGAEAERAFSRGAAPASAAAPAKADWRQRNGGANMDEGQVLNRAEDMIRYSAAAQASAGETGEAFRYEISAPVTIERQRSAMLPILAEPVQGERVSIYNIADAREHPMRGVELTNTSAFELSPGPISVFDGGGYLGDAQIGFTSKGQQRLLSYAVDLDVRAITEQNQAEEVVKVKISQGSIEQQSTSRLTTTYKFTNRDGKHDRTILVEQPKKPGWDVTAPAKPRSESENLRRYEVKLDRAAQAKLDVVEQRTNWSRIAVTSMDLPTILSYAKSDKASKSVTDALKKAGGMLAGINDLETKAKKLKDEAATITGDQGRIRQNMNTIDHNSELYARYMKTLSDQENRMGEMNAQASDLGKQIDAAKAELTKYLTELTVE